MADELEEKIKENAEGPRRARGDAAEMEQHPLKDQIEVDRYLRSKDAVKQGRGFRLTKMVPPGA